MYERQPDFDADLARAKDPKTDSKELSRLASKHFGEIEIARAVAQNPSCERMLFARFWRLDQAMASKNPAAEKYQADPNWQQSIRSDPYRRYRASQPTVYELLWVMNGKDGALQRFVMAFEDISEAVVREHAGAKSAPLRKVIASRKTAPDDVFQTLAKDSAKTVRQAVAANPDAPPHVIATLVNDREDAVADAARTNPACPDEAVHRARLADASRPTAADTDTNSLTFAEATSLAGSSATPTTKLAELAEHEEPCVRFLAGLNLATPTEALTALANDSETWVRASAAFNLNTPSEALASLLSSKLKDIQIGLASNPGLPEEDQLQLAATIGDGPGETLANLTQFPSVWQKLAEKVTPVKKAKDKTWRHYLAEMLASGDKRFGGLSQGPKSLSLCVTRAAARSEKCPAGLLRHYAHYLFDDYSQNPAAALALLEGKTHVQAAPYADWKVKMWLTEARPPGQVSNYYIKSDDPKRRAQAVSSSTTELVYLLPIVLDDNTVTRKRLAQRGDVNRFICEMLIRDPKSGVREAIAKNKRCPKELLGSLHGDKATTVRAVVNKRAPSAGKSGKSKKGIVNQGSATERARLAKNSEDPKLLTELATDRAASVRRAVVENYKTPYAVIGNLASDTDARIREHVARRSHDRDIVTALVGDSEASVRLKAARNGIWYEYAEGNKYQIWDQKFLADIADTSDEALRAIAAEHTDDKSLRIQFIKDMPVVTQKLATNRHMDIKEKLALANYTDDQDTLGALAHRTKSEELFILAAQKITSNHVNDPIRCHQEMLLRPNVQDALCTHPLPVIRRAVAWKKPLSPKAAKILAQDPEEWVRRSLS